MSVKCKHVPWSVALEMGCEAEWTVDNPHHVDRVRRTPNPTLTLTLTPTLTLTLTPTLTLGQYRTALSVRLVEGAFAPRVYRGVVDSTFDRCPALHLGRATRATDLAQVLEVSITPSMLYPGRDEVLGDRGLSFGLRLASRPGLGRERARAQHN